MRKTMLMLVICLAVIAVMTGFLLCSLVLSNKVQGSQENALEKENVQNTESEIALDSTDENFSEETEYQEATDSLLDQGTDVAEKDTFAENENDLPFLRPEDAIQQTEGVESITSPTEPLQTEDTEITTRPTESQQTGNDAEDDISLPTTQPEEVEEESGNDLPFAGI